MAADGDFVHGLHQWAGRHGAPGRGMPAPKVVKKKLSGKRRGRMVLLKSDIAGFDSTVGEGD